MQVGKPSAKPKDGTNSDLFRSFWWFVPAYMLLFYAAEPVFDWLAAHPVEGVAAIGLFSFTLFAIDAIRGWRDGSAIAQGVRDRMQNVRIGQPENMRGVYLIVAALVLAWLAVTAFAIGAATEDQQPTVILVVGGITAFIGAPFALYPATLLFGLLSRPGRLEARTTFHIEAPVADALVLRADLTRMPPANGLGPVEQTSEDHWESRATNLEAILAGLKTEYRIETGNPGQLTILATTSGGDLERVTLEPQGDTQLDAAFLVEVRSAWARAVLRIAGPRSFAGTVAATEAARLSRMLGTEVSHAAPDLL